MIKNKQHFIKTETRVKIYSIIFFLVFILVGIQHSGSATPQQEPAIDYHRIFSDSNNIFSLDPNIAKEIFFELAILSGNKKAAKKRINQEIFSCKEGNRDRSYCNHVRNSRKELKENLLVHIVAKNVESYSQGRLKKRKRLSLQWQPETWLPPKITPDEFFAYLGAAKNSKLYRLDDQILEIQMVVNFPRRIDLILDHKLADNIVNLYRNSFKTNDWINLFLDSISISKVDGTLTLILDFKVKKLSINNMLLDAESDYVL